jgi:hypothetical protein
MKQTLKIDKEGFLGWRFNYKEDFEELEELALNYLKGKEKEKLSLDYIFSVSGYLPTMYIINLDEVNLHKLGYVYDDEVNPEVLIRDFNILWV